MKAVSLLILLTALSACSTPDTAPTSYPEATSATPPAAPSTDPASYRSGYQIGRTDSGYGYPKDAHRAYTRLGQGDEASFQSGYSDGYDGSRMAQ
jgi:hypothetical protein